MKWYSECTKWIYLLTIQNKSSLFLERMLNRDSFNKPSLILFITLLVSDKKTACQEIGGKKSDDLTTLKMLGDLKVSNQVFTIGDNFKIKYYINNEHKEAIYDGIACSIATATWMG